MGFLDSLTEEQWRELKDKALPLGTDTEWGTVREVLQGAERATPIPVFSFPSFQFTVDAARQMEETLNEAGRAAQRLADEMEADDGPV